MTSSLDPFHRISQAFTTDQGLKIRIHKNGEVSFKTVATDEEISQLVIDQLFVQSPPPTIPMDDENDDLFSTIKASDTLLSPDEKEKFDQWDGLEKAMNAKAAKLDKQRGRGGIIGWFQRLTGKAKRLEQAATKIRVLAREVNLLKRLIGPTQMLIYQSKHPGQSLENQPQNLIRRSREIAQKPPLYVAATELESNGQKTQLVQQVITTLKNDHEVNQLEPEVRGLIQRLVAIKLQIPPEEVKNRSSI